VMLYAMFTRRSLGVGGFIRRSVLAGSEEIGEHQKARPNPQ